MDGLISVNAEVMAVFASTSSGTTAESFSTREEKYNNIIGKFDALVLQANARPVPKNQAVDVINHALQRRGIPPLADGEIPSATALQKVSETLVKMRDTDKKQGLTSYPPKDW